MVTERVTFADCWPAHHVRPFSVSTRGFINEERRYRNEYLVKQRETLLKVLKERFQKNMNVTKVLNGRK